MPVQQDNSVVVSRWLMRLLLVAVILVDLVAGRWAAEYQRAWPDPFVVCFVGFLFTQVFWGAAWLIWGRQNIVVRVVGIALAIGGWADLLSRWVAVPWEKTVGLLVLLSAVSAVAMLLWRAWSMARDFRENPDRPVPKQFSLWQLMSLTTGTAVLLGLLRLAGPEMDRWPAVAALCLLLCLISILPAWLMAGRCHYLVVWLGSLIGCSLLGFTAPLTGCTPNHTVTMIFCALAQAATTILVAHVYCVAHPEIPTHGVRSVGV